MIKLSDAISPRFTAELKADSEVKNFTRQVKDAFYSYVNTKSPAHPELVHYSAHLANQLGIVENPSKELIEVLSGANQVPNYKSYSMRYGGHQFGQWAGQLGDGRAINIGEFELNSGHVTFQLKGAGPTPYSRSADGLAVLRSSIREYLCSEAMYHLSIPTTRALSLIKTGDAVSRDILYNGNRKDEPGAVVCRVSKGFIRFGNFEILAARREIDNLRQLVDYTIKYYYSELGKPSKETYLSFFKSVVDKTRSLMIDWLRVGFVHGVMNTDNMSILGETIDYGPYGWLENYDPNWTPNTTDAQHKRYRFANQPNIGLWNLVQLANALYPLVEDAEPFQEILEDYKESYHRDFHSMMCRKLGLRESDSISKDFIDQLQELMEKSQVDYIMFYRELSHDTPKNKSEWTDLLKRVSYLEQVEVQNHMELWEAWTKEYQSYIISEKVNGEDRFSDMKNTNPKYVLRNYMAQLAIESAEEGDYTLVDELYNVLLNPYNENNKYEKWYAKRPDWALNKVGCSMLSCSS